MLLAALAAAVEVAAPLVVEDRIEARARAATRNVAAVSADADSFPFVPTLLSTGRIRRLAVTLDEVGGQQVPLAALRYELRGVQLDRDALWRREVELRSIDSGVVVVELTESALSEALGRTVELLPGGSAPDLPVALPAELVPCEPTAEVAEGRVLLSCPIGDVPPILTRGP